MFLKNLCTYLKQKVLIVLTDSTKVRSFLRHWSAMAESAWDIPYLKRKIFLFRYQIFQSYFFVINFLYFVIRFLLNSSIVKSSNKIGRVNDKKKISFKNETGKSRNRKKVLTDPYFQ